MVLKQKYAAKNGGINTFEMGPRLTTTDALQLQWLYCSNDEGFEYKETVDCFSKDIFGFPRKVFRDRLCDGYFDCPFGEDESMGPTWKCERQFSTCTATGSR